MRFGIVLSIYIKAQHETAKTCTLYIIYLMTSESDLFSLFTTQLGCGYTISRRPAWAPRTS